MNQHEHECLQRALAGDLTQLRALVDRLGPVVRARVARALSRYPQARRPHELEVLTQEVFVSLFASDAKLLRKWDPTRGLSLRNFVGLLAQQRVAELLRGQRKSGNERVALEDSQLRLAQRDSGEDGEARSASRELLSRLLTYLEAHLSTLGLELFERLYVNGESVAQVCEATGMSPDAVYQWRSRLAKAAREGMQALEAEGTEAVGALQMAPAKGRRT